MIDWLPLILFDFCLFAGCVLLLFRRLSFYHPATLYLAFHFYAISMRLWAIASGSPTMYADYYWTQSYRAIASDEIVRAVLLADLALAAFVFGVVIASKSILSPTGRFMNITMNPTNVLYVSLICFPVGLVVFVLQRGDASGSAEFLNNGYLFMAALWPLNCLCALVFCYGFRAWLTISIAIILLVFALQGYHRFMSVLPVLFLISVFLLRSGRRWPTWAMAFVALAGILIFPQLKYIGRAASAGDTAELGRILGVVFLRQPDINSKDEQFLDQYAGALTMSDDQNFMLFGASYSAILTLPIPRAWWPEKPGLADHVIALSSPDRPYDVEGRIITYIGEAYLNFGTIGIVFVPFLLGYGLTAWYIKANVGERDNLRRYVYLAAMPTLILLYRDGLSSLILFGFFFNLPMIMIWLMHFWQKRSPQIISRVSP